MGAIVNLVLDKNPKPSGRGGNGDGKIGARMGYTITILERGELGSGISRGKVRRRVTFLGEKDEADAGQKREREASRRRRQKRIIWRWISMERRRSEAPKRSLAAALSSRPWGEKKPSKASGSKDCVSQKDMSVLTRFCAQRVLCSTFCRSKHRLSIFEGRTCGCVYLEQ